MWGLPASDRGHTPVCWHCPAWQSEGWDMPPLSSHSSALALQEQRLLEEASRVHHHRGVHGGAQGSVLPPEAPPVSVHPTVSPAPPALDPPWIIQHPVRLPWVNLGGRTNGEGAVPPETSHLSRDCWSLHICALSSLRKCAEGAISSVATVAVVHVQPCWDKRVLYCQASQVP